MRAPNAFVLNLRRLRLQKGISLEEIASRTNVSVELWEAMEANDFSRWPTGVAARAYIRDYASIVGADRDETVDEFCRVNPHGDRRGYRLLQETAEALGHELVWRDDLPPDAAGGDRRTPLTPPVERESLPWWYVNRRGLVAVFDLLLVILVAGIVSAVVGVNWWATVAACALLYHSLSLACLGCSLSVRAIDAYLSAHRPTDRRGVVSVFPGLSLMVDEPPAHDRRAAD